MPVTETIAGGALDHRGPAAAAFGDDRLSLGEVDRHSTRFANAF